EIRPVALKEFMRPGGEENIEVSRRAAAHAGFALSRQANPCPVFNTGGNVDRQRALFGAPPLSVTFHAWIRNGLPASAALRASALDREETLRRAHPPRAGTHGACHRSGAGPGAASGTFIALGCRGDQDLGSLA